jgi:hypothetical protein
MSTAHTGKFVAYYRVSTQRQGRSGLGLEAQQGAVRDYLNGGDWRLVAELTEVESGKRSDRPKLAKALKLCRLHGATLIIAKLDRLARNVAFVSNLMESGAGGGAGARPSLGCRPVVKELQAVGATSLRAIAEGLNERRIPTAKGGQWSATQVMRVLERMDERRPFAAAA